MPVMRQALTPTQTKYANDHRGARPRTLQDEGAAKPDPVAMESKGPARRVRTIRSITRRPARAHEPLAARLAARLAAPSTVRLRARKPQRRKGIGRRKDADRASIEMTRQVPR